MATVAPRAAQTYLNATPFPHIVIDGAFDGERVAQVASEVGRVTAQPLADCYAQRRKSALNRPDQMGAATADLIAEMGAPRFIQYLERMTGIAGLRADPDLFGGGVHSIGRGGFLKVHADFNWHAKLQLHRRINVLLYLNEGWDEDWGGALELWRQDMSACAVRVAPLLNRMVIFSTTDTSYHGHPEPLRCPERVRRNSIALYYYSAESASVRPGNKITDYRRRPGEWLGVKHLAHQAMIRGGHHSRAMGGFSS